MKSTGKRILSLITLVLLAIFGMTLAINSTQSGPTIRANRTAALAPTLAPVTFTPPPTASGSVFNAAASLPTGTYTTRTHTVQPGETLFRIASQYGVSVDVIAAVNGLTDPDRLAEGQTLQIPLPATTLTPSPVPTNTATPRPTIAPGELPPWPEAINGVPLEELLIMPPETVAQVRAIYHAGQGLGRYPTAFSKLGDSTIENPHFLARFDDGPYVLGPYAFLQPVINAFQGSFGRQGAAVQRGLNTAVAFDPMWARDSACPPGVGPLDCEIALHNPAFIFIRVGTNDRNADAFRENLRAIVARCIEQGVVPLLGTKADRRPGTEGNDAIIREVAAEFHVPLWDFDRVADTLPGRGLTVDGVHLVTYFAHDYSRAEALTRGYAVHNLLALMILDRVWQAVNAPG